MNEIIKDRTCVICGYVASSRFYLILKDKYNFVCPNCEYEVKVGLLPREKYLKRKYEKNKI